MLLGCFAWLVWLLCACIVRRIKGLWRFCLCFYPFASVFALVLSFCPFLCSLCSCLSFCLVFPFLLCVFVALWVWLLFPFPFRTIRKKKGRSVLVRPLLSCCGCLDSCIVIKKFRCRCFGFFYFVRLVFPTNAARVGRLARSYFDFLGHNVNIANNRSAFLK